MLKRLRRRIDLRGRRMVSRRRRPALRPRGLRDGRALAVEILAPRDAPPPPTEAKLPRPALRRLFPDARRLLAPLEALETVIPPPPDVFASLTGCRLRDCAASLSALAVSWERVFLASTGSWDEISPKLDKTDRFRVAPLCFTNLVN